MEGDRLLGLSERRVLLLLLTCGPLCCRCRNGPEPEPGGLPAGTVYENAGGQRVRLLGPGRAGVTASIASVAAPSAAGLGYAQLLGGRRGVFLAEAVGSFLTGRNATGVFS